MMVNMMWLVVFLVVNIATVFSLKPICKIQSDCPPNTKCDGEYCVPDKLDCSNVICENLHDPVCGSDGKTYSNRCNLNAARCFEPSLKEMHKGECGKATPCTTKDNSAPVLLGAFVPKCKSDGTFEDRQCHGSTGECWCVDPKTGQEIEETRKAPGSGNVNCKSCKHLASNTQVGKGAYIPQCADDGTFHVKQCHSSTGYCWCVETKFGNEVEGTRKGPGEEVNCKPCKEPELNTEGLVGAYDPQCASDGTYKKIQCHGSTGYCWCVETRFGNEIKGTRKGPAEGKVECEPVTKSCTNLLATSKFAVGAFIPKCKKDGSYEEKQCHGSTGFCWCADGKSGKEIPGTKKRGEANCDVKSCSYLIASARYAVGAFVPKCKKDGSYEEKQCDASTGDCWCVVSKSGKEISGTRKGATDGEVTCELLKSAPASCRNLLGKTKFVVGAFIPACKKDGSYKEKQCHGSTGFCWCVDGKSGKEIPGTKKGPKDGEVNCGSCKSVSSSNAQLGRGAFVPKCGTDGNYKAKQCHGSTGYCWCVHTRYGNEIKGSRRGPGQGEVNCETCQAASSNAVFMPGVSAPKCNSNGEYKRRQCHGSTGYCWCVETMYGAEIKGTRKGPSEGEVTCEPCATDNSLGVPGAFSPECNLNGGYNRKQCHGSTGYCWCVETMYGTEIKGTRKGPSEGEVTCGAKKPLLEVLPEVNLNLKSENDQLDGNSNSASTRYTTSFTVLVTLVSLVSIFLSQLV